MCKLLPMFSTNPNTLHIHLGSGSSLFNVLQFIVIFADAQSHCITLHTVPSSNFSALVAKQIFPSETWAHIASPVHSPLGRHTLGRHIRPSDAADYAGMATHPPYAISPRTPHHRQARCLGHMPCQAHLPLRHRWLGRHVPPQACPTWT